MFTFSATQRKAANLASAKQKLHALVSLHIKTLAIRRHSGISVDAYGTVDASGWMKEAQYFVDGVWSPQLSADEKSAVFDAGLNAIAQEMIEVPVREQCSRMSASGAYNMNVHVRHPPDLAVASPPQTRHLITSISNASKAITPASHVSSGLIIDEPWIGHILDGRKSWEMRTTAVTKRGKIALIAKGTKTIVGVSTLTDSIGPLDDQEIVVNEAKHLVPLSRIGKWRHAWVLANTVRLRYPVPYSHPSGAVKWVNLDDLTVSAIMSAMP